MFNRILLIILMLTLSMHNVVAQEWKDLFKGVASAVEDKVSEKISEKVDTLMLIGTWQYVRPDVKLESENLISKAGSEFAAKKIEEHLVDVLSKIGINEQTVFTFNSDSTYTLRTEKSTLKGTYSSNIQNHEIVMTSQFRIQFTAVIDQNFLKPENISFRFKAEKLMAFAKHVSGTLAQKSTNKSIILLNQLLNNYDSVTVGFELKKQK